MSLHSETEIYRAAADLAGFVLRAGKDLRREVKPLLGGMLLDEALWIMVLIRRANIARDLAKLPHLVEILEHLEIVQAALQVAHSQRFLPTRLYADSMQFTASVGRQAQALKSHFDVAPAS